ncbi:MAG: YggS family pyridoxal phosphate-dependent enzyme [Spirochaetota bacterium]|nr:MAG: YggS family pyridoxal phosphate-dependent enzyme [Spirochaetota bacterium]
MASIKDNLDSVNNKINNALNRNGRKDHVTLVAVSKTIPVEKINEAVEAGITDLGENRVQEAEQKFGKVKKGPTWHLVGHLQRNKVKKALPLFSMIQSIDKLDTAIEIEKRASSPVDILIEINSSGEVTKSGIPPDKLFFLIDELRSLSMVKIKGLMTIGPFTSDEKLIRNCFSLMKKKYDELQTREKDLDICCLSMGMSMDYEIAIDEGSNMIRIGTAIFGERVYG